MNNTTVENLISLVRYHTTKASSCAFDEGYSGSQFHTDLVLAVLDMIDYKFSPERELLESVIVTHFSCLNAAEEKWGYGEAINASSRAIRELRDELIKIEEKYHEQR